MSIEAFFDTHRPHSEMRQLFEAETGETKPWPLLNKFATQMIEAGRERLAKLTDEYLLYNAGEVTPSLIATIVRNGMRDMGAVILGNSIISINDTICDGEVDLNVLRSRLIHGFRNTGIYVGELDEDEREIGIIPRLEWEDMIEAAAEDKTLTVFLKNQDLIPGKLSDYLMNANTLAFINPILPQYEIRARLLVA